MGQLERAPFRPHLARVGSPDACDAIEQLFLTLPLQGGDAEHLAALHAERDAAQRVAASEVLDFERRRPRGPVRGCSAPDGRRRLLGDVGPEHEIDDRLLGPAGRGHPHCDAVAEDRGAIAERAHFREAMGDEDDARAALSPAAHNREDALGKVRGQRGGDLIQHQDARI